jgi:fused signal recognition particle receptor
MSTTWIVLLVIVIVVAILAFTLLSGKSRGDREDAPEPEDKKKHRPARTPATARDAAPGSAEKHEKPAREPAKPKAEKEAEKPPKKTPENSKAPPERDAATDGSGAVDEPSRASDSAATRAETDERAEKAASEPRSAVSPSQPPTAAAPSGGDRLERRTAFKKGLLHTRGGFIAKLGSLLRGKKTVDADLLDKIEEILLTSDVGMKFTERLTEALNTHLTGKELSDPDAVWSFIRAQAEEVLTPSAKPLDVSTKRPFVIMVVGVNGVGKTTTIAKLASRYTHQGKKVVLAAGDTFRAAAVRQLEMWGERVGAPVIKDDKQGADPASVVFKAIEHAMETGADVVIADTAGRLHTKTPLMDELKKVKRVMGKALEGAPHEVLLVLDANTGQNANLQVQKFKDDLDVTGIVLTKLDGTAKGGVILGICDEHHVPVRFIGVGERDNDLREFDAEDFVTVLFERPEADTESAA